MKDGYIKVPIRYTEEEEYYIISGFKGKYKFTESIIAQGDNKEQAESSFLSLLDAMYTLYERDANKYRLWCPLIIGPGGTAGKWFSIFGILFYFRYGKKCKHGFFIPLTNLNIMITNQWKTLYKNNRA